MTSASTGTPAANTPPRRTMAYNQLSSCPDMELAFVEMYERTRADTLTSLERMYGLYKATEHVSTHGIDGDIVECGTWRGGSCMLAAMALSIALQFRRFGRKIPFHLTAGKTTNWVIPIFTMVTVLYGPMWWAVAILGTVGGYAVVEELILILTREDLDEHVTSMFSKRRRNAVD